VAGWHDVPVTAPAQDSTRPRVAAGGDGIGPDELALAARYRAMPLDALRFSPTPSGLHYVFSHYDMPAIDARTWTLLLGGAVREPLELDLAGLCGRGAHRVPVTMEGAGNGRGSLIGAVGTAYWTGVPLATLLAEAGVAPGAVEVVFTGADCGVQRGVEENYQRALPLAEALDPDVIVAYEMDGFSLPVQHGYPARLILPGRYGTAQVKWLKLITVSRTASTGFQNTAGQRHAGAPGEDGEPMPRIRPRALMVPPGYPDSLSPTRFVGMGEHQLNGRAWSGTGPITAVDVSGDGGATWVPAELSPLMDDWTWRWWTCWWTVTKPGRYELLARATDAAGNVQPVTQPAGVPGMASNVSQPVVVIAR
jgi:DMSO/TMAO reductase YedYZ molybdopterin-dependent catalytic subunit